MSPTTSTATEEFLDPNHTQLLHAVSFTSCIPAHGSIISSKMANSKKVICMSLISTCILFICSKCTSQKQAYGRQLKPQLCYRGCSRLMPLKLCAHTLQQGARTVFSDSTKQGCANSAKAMQSRHRRLQIGSTCGTPNYTSDSSYIAGSRTVPGDNWPGTQHFAIVK